MSNPTTRLRTTLLRLTVIWSCWLRAYHSALAKDIVVQNTDPLIVYQPQASWHSSSDSCANCLSPEGGTSYHEAIYPPIGPDADDTSTTTTSPNTSTESPASSSSTTPSPNVAAAVPTTKTTSKDDGPNKGSSPGPNPGTGSSSGKRRRRGMNRRLDPDDPGFQAPDVSLSFNFTGSAIYIYGIQPLGVATAATNNTPTNMNLTFTLDSETMGDFNSTGSPTVQGYNSNQTFFSKSNLEEAPHEFIIHVGQNSTFIFDYLIYSTNSTVNSTTTSAVPSMPSPSTNQMAKKHDVATFAGAVGGSVGVLALFSLGLAISLIRRRRLAARRDRLEGESLHTNGSDDSPNMSGPAPFVPRFFPDTVIPSDPPTYLAATNHNSSTLLAALSLNVYPASTLSYADVPPSSPPPPLEDLALIPPPPFPLAVSTQPAPVLSVSDVPPSIPEANAASHNLDSSVQSDPTRTQSRASSRSISYDIHGNPLANSDEEEILRYRY